MVVLIAAEVCLKSGACVIGTGRMLMCLRVWYLSIWLCLSVIAATQAEDVNPEHRTPHNEAELERWLKNMIWHHRFSDDEIQSATGLMPE